MVSFSTLIFDSFAPFPPIFWLTRSNFLTNVDCWVLLQKKKFFFSRTFFIYQMKKAFEKGWKSRKIHFFFILSKKHQTHHIKKCFCDQALLQTLKYVVYHVLQTIKCILYYLHGQEWTNFELMVWIFQTKQYLYLWTIFTYQSIFTLEI